MIRTRFAPSPTGYLHIGGARTALFSWAYARKHNGKFILRVEDTDLERSTEASVQAILEGMRWLGLDWDEGPFFQMQRLARYREVAERLVREGKAYHCYCSREELDRMREEQRARGEKPRYDARWRPENARAAGLAPPPGVQPVVRFRNPREGEVWFNDLVKGAITVSNAELDDLVLLRADGVPTYNFGVVVDDLDMKITHVIRGDDHVNNTPRQVNIFQALGAELPRFAHVPMILGPDGERLSKRHGAVSVMQYHEDGYLPEAVVNTLARLGWSHGDEEVFSMRQFIEWFDLGHISKSAAQFNPEKLRWMNQEYMKNCSIDRLADLLRPKLEELGAAIDVGPKLTSVVELLKGRAVTVRHLAEEAMLFYRYQEPSESDVSQFITAEIKPALRDLLKKLAEQTDWTRTSLSATTTMVLRDHHLKMPQLAMPLRVIVTGRTRTPSIDAVLELVGKDIVLSRLRNRVG